MIGIPRLCQSRQQALPHHEHGSHGTCTGTVGGRAVLGGTPQDVKRRRQQKQAVAPSPRRVAARLLATLPGSDSTRRLDNSASSSACVLECNMLIHVMNTIRSNSVLCAEILEPMQTNCCTDHQASCRGKQSAVSAVSSSVSKVYQCDAATGKPPPARSRFSSCRASGCTVSTALQPPAEVPSGCIPRRSLHAYAQCKGRGESVSRSEWRLAGVSASEAVWTQR